MKNEQHLKAPSRSDRQCASPRLRGYSPFKRTCARHSIAWWGIIHIAASAEDKV